MNTASHRCFRVVLITLFGALCVVTALVCVGIGTIHFSLREIAKFLGADCKNLADDEINFYVYKKLER